MPPFVTILQKIESLIAPVVLRSGSSSLNPVLELSYYRGRFQLSTEHALYSDGIRYRPIVAAFKSLKNFLQVAENALVLGGGIGSAVELLYKYNPKTHCTLVEKDEVVMKWALEVLDNKYGHLQAITADAKTFMESNVDQYDLIIIDIFIDLGIPEFVLSGTFLDQCAQALKPNGKVVLNTIHQSEVEERKTKEKVERYLPKGTSISFGYNTVFISGV